MLVVIGLVRQPEVDTGAIVEEREWEELDSNWSAVNTIMSSEATHIFNGLVERYPDRTSDFLKSAVTAGKELTASSIASSNGSLRPGSQRASISATMPESVLG